MKELRSIKSGKLDIISDEEYAEMVENDKDRKNANKLLPRFVVTDLRMRPIIPSMKEPTKVQSKVRIELPTEIKITKKK